MPVVEQKLGAMAKPSQGIAQPSQGIANRSASTSEKRLSTARAIASPAKDEDKVCWIETNHYPYQPDHQVELLHLQAEADALLIKLQARGQRQLNAHTSSIQNPTT